MGAVPVFFSQHEGQNQPACCAPASSVHESMRQPLSAIVDVELASGPF